MTLTEMMVSVGAGSLVLAGIGTVFTTSSMSFAAMGNYITMDRSSRSAMDQMTRDIRQSKNLISYATNQLVFDYDGAGTKLVYQWNPATSQLTQWKTGGQTNVLLSHCVALSFSMYNNMPQPGGTFASTTTVSAGKSFVVAWKCSQNILGRTITSEDMQQALIVTRSKPVL
jgi:type II secretory pathway component PulJ